jgi:hypothetical protein
MKNLLTPRSILIAAAWLALPAAVLAADKKSEPIVFNRDIRPILSDNCYTCHGPDKNQRKGKLRLDTEAGAFEKTESEGFAIVRGDVKKSLLIERIMNKDPEEHMPPKKSGKELKPEQIDLLKRWIEQGAVWQPHWSYIPPQRPPVPAVANKGAVRNPIDAFILARLEKEGLKPNSEADKVTLCRRLYFDLIGLPPTPQDVDAFVKDTGADAYDKLVDKLLASPHFGERMAVHWLDLVRYADSIGYHSDNSRNVSPYRDYVIKAFNENKKFDEFTTEQIAGDLLPNATVNQKIASAYNRLILSTEEGGAQAKEYDAKNNSDKVRNLGTVWLGATLLCCECHDHKFDPYLQKDFYSLAAFFTDIKEAAIGRREDGMMVATPEQEVELKKYDEEIAALKKQLDTTTPELEKAQAEWENVQRAAKTAEWTALVPVNSESEGGATIKIGKDNALTVSGKNPEKDTYKITCTTKLKGITALRMDVLADKSLPASGPGRAGNGNFVLNEFEVTVAGKPLKLSAATATHSQNDFNIVNTIDGKLETGWAILDHTGKDTQAVFECPENIGGDAETTIVITMKHNYGGSHAIGRFRFFTTNADRPVKAGAAMGLPHEIADIVKLDADKRNDAQKQKLAAHFRGLAPALQPLRDSLKTVESKKTELEKKVPRCLVSVAENPRPIRILPRGNWMDESNPPLMPATPHFLKQLDVKDRRANRLDLTKWLLADDNPLVARVFVNRFWRMFYGTGLTKSLDDVGAQGEWPTHPELLDWLAVEFREGWDMKKMIRLMVTSNTYRQSSVAPKEVVERDLDNRLYARSSRWRVDAEFVRDNALAVSGLLSPKMYGPSVKPYQPRGYWQHLNFPGREWENDKDENCFRRGLYTWWQRTFLQPGLLAFNASSREDCCAERARSTTPQQALVLLNDPTYVEAARAFAQRTIKEGGADFAKRLEWAFTQALDRKPRADEQKLLADLHARHLEQYKKDPKEAEKLLSVGISPPSKDGDVAELAAWTSVTRVIFNLQEFIWRN